MNFMEFTTLTHERKLNVIAKEGVCIAKKKYEGYTTSLYQVEGFYVEVHYNILDNNILKLRSFTSTLPLDAYLKNFSVSKILKRSIVVPFIEVLDLMEPILLSIGI